VSVRASTAALAALLGLAGCWGQVSEVDLVADAGVAAPVLEPGVYCPVQIWAGFTEIDYADCDRVGWDEGEARHYYADARVRWDEREQRPQPARTLDGFGATSVWLAAADLGGGLALLQRTAAEGGSFGENIVAPGRYVSIVVVAGEAGFAVLPTVEGDAFRTLADGRGVELEPYEIDDSRGLRISAGAPEAARGLVADAASAWLQERRQAGGDYRQRPADEGGIGPFYYVRLEALDESLPITVAVESAMFEIEQQIRTAAGVP
jgi:hypothetical protein